MRQRGSEWPVARRPRSRGGQLRKLAVHDATAHQAGARKKCAATTKYWAWRATSTTTN